VPPVAARTTDLPIHRAAGSAQPERWTAATPASIRHRSGRVSSPGPVARSRSTTWPALILDIEVRIGRGGPHSRLARVPGLRLRAGRRAGVGRMQTDNDVQVVVFDSTDPEFFMAHLDPSGRRRSTTRPGSGFGDESNAAANGGGFSFSIRPRAPRRKLTGSRHEARGSACAGRSTSVKSGSACSASVRLGARARSRRSGRR
jgi:hypothetical protein